MDLIRAAFVFNARYQLRPLAGHGRVFQNFLAYLAHLLQPRHRPKTLLLIERAGIAKTVLSDRMVQIETAKAPSFVTILAIQYRSYLSRAKAACVSFASGLGWAYGKSDFGLDEEVEPYFLNNERNWQIEDVQTTRDNPPEIAFCASIDVRKWETAG